MPTTVRPHCGLECEYKRGMKENRKKLDLGRSMQDKISDAICNVKNYYVSLLDLILVEIIVKT